MESQFRGRVGWYSLKFTAPRSVPGFGWGVRFEQSRRVTKAWLNGVPIGGSADPYVPFTLPATGLKAGRENTLLVRVDNRKGREPREGWWNWGGLTRPVSLVPRGLLELRDPALMSKVDCEQGGAVCRASVLVDGVLVNRSGTEQPAPKVSVALTPPGGGRALRHTETASALHPGESRRVRFSFAVPDPELWSPGSPKLYDGTITTFAKDARPVQIDHQRLGLRSVKVVNGMLELNGRQLDLRGASLQEDVPGRGPALTDADMDRIVAELKALGANVTRAHYALNQRLLDRLDSAGIMVWSQAPIYHRDRLLETPRQRDAALATLRGTVKAARTHASVITNNVANELSVVPDAVPGTKAYLDAAARATRDLDPTLPVSVDLLSYPGFGVQRTYAQYDLLGINSYFGWYPGKADHSTERLGDLAPYLDHMRDLYPRQGLVLTEFGAESTMDGPAATKETYAFQSRYVRQVLDIVEQRPFVSGAIYWTLREFAVKPDWDGGADRVGVARDGIHNKGLIRYGGGRKPAWTVAARDFAATPLYREVAPAVAANVAQGREGGNALVVWSVVLGVIALILLDGWALRGILGARRRDPAPVDEVAAAREAAAARSAA
ncbi:MAG TPA: glycoside hydrolase family 2 TIM barrel-domain containing protein [Solirubrobacteraceae bacterium]